MKQFFGFLAMLLPVVSNGQPLDAPPLSISDAIPEIIIDNVQNYKDSVISLKDLTEKVVVLDFMTTGCISCLEALPRLDSIQKEYKGKVIIFLVSPEPSASIRSFLKRKNNANLILPVIANDTTLSKLFVHTYISHEVIIKDGIVKAITWPEYITAENIELLLNDAFVSLPIKSDIIYFNFKKPLFHLNENEIPANSYPNLIGYGSITSYMENIPERFTRYIDSGKNALHISMINVPIIHMYARVLTGARLVPAFVRLPADSGRYVYNRNAGYYHDWLAKNVYCYEGMFPLNYSDSLITEKIKNDLNFYFSLNGRMKKQMTACWVVRKIKPFVNKKHKKQAHVANQGLSIKSIAYGLNQEYGGMPVIDESGNPELKIIGLPKDPYGSISVINQHLKEYGFIIERAERLLDLLVITEIN